MKNVSKKILLLATGFLLLAGCGNANGVEAVTSTTLYFAPTDDFKSGASGVRVNVHYGSNDSDPWGQIPMTLTEDTYHGRGIYVAEFDDKWNGLATLQFQAMNNSTVLKTDEVFKTWTTPDSYNSKMRPKEYDALIDYTCDETISVDQDLFLDVTNWKEKDKDDDFQRFAAFFYNGTSSDWADMVEVSNNIYKVNAPDEGYTTVIFCRMDGSKPENKWENKWNQTANLYSGLITNNLFVISTMEGEGSWKKYTAIEDIFGLVDNNYTRQTQINFTDAAFRDAVTTNIYKEDNFTMSRTTTWIDGALYMENGDKINSGYFTAKDGKMHHFKFDGTVHPVTSVDNTVIDDGQVANVGVNEYFSYTDNKSCSMHYLHEEADNIADKFTFDTSKASVDTVSYWTQDEDIVRRFLAICAPCYVNNPTDKEHDHFVNLKTATVQLNADGSMELALYVDPEDTYSTNKLNGGSNKFAWATIDKINTSVIPSILPYLPE